MMTHAFHVAEDKRDAVVFRKPADFLVDHRSQFCLPIITRQPGSLISEAAFDRAAPHRFSSGLACDPLCDSVEPIREQFAIAQQFRFFDQHEKRRLERILCFMRIIQYATANSLNHGPVPNHECPKCRLSPLSLGQK
jgi:hypothetical protein